MPDTILSGLLITTLSGLVMGTSPWPLKLKRRFQYEHFAFVSMLFALVVLLLSMGVFAFANSFAAGPYK